jgi:hypothetical protein
MEHLSNDLEFVVSICQTFEFVTQAVTSKGSIGPAFNQNKSSTLDRSEKEGVELFLSTPRSLLNLLEMISFSCP